MRENVKKTLTLVSPSCFMERQQAEAARACPVRHIWDPQQQHTVAEGKETGEVRVLRFLCVFPFPIFPLRTRSTDHRQLADTKTPRTDGWWLCYLRCRLCAEVSCT